MSDIKELLQLIDRGDYLIPEFQRGYVWNANQVKGFMNSLYLGYPSGSFLIWKTEEPSETRGDVDNKNLVYKNLILDGQQRLTTIYTIFKGETPAWYEGVSLRTDLYFNLETEVFQYYKQREMEGKKEWIHVSDYLVNGALTGFMGRFGELSDEFRSYYIQPHVMERLTKLGQMESYNYHIQEVQLTEVEKVVDIFNLVNKSGTTLSESDLALAIVSSTWEGTKHKFRAQIEEYKKVNFEFDFNFFTRLLNMLTTNQARYGQIAKQTPADFDLAWEKINNSLSYLINVLREDAYVDSFKNLSSVYVLYTLVYYLSKNNNQFPSEEDKNKAVYWMFMAQLWGWYSGSSESYLDKDINSIEDGNGIDGLINNLSLSRGSNLYLTADDMAYQGVRSKIFPVFYAAIRSQGAKDWGDSNVPLYSKNIGSNNALERHYIFPKTYLKGKYDSRNSLEKNLVNEISNQALITKKSSSEFLNTPPSEYLLDVSEEQLYKQFVPLDSEIYTLEHYEFFLQKRRKLIADGLNEFLASYYNFQSKDQIASELQHFDESIERIEIAFREKINSVLCEAAEEDPYAEFISPGLQGDIKKQVNRHLSKNPGEDPADYTDLRSRLDFFVLSQYKQVIAGKETWTYFEESFGNKVMFEKRFDQFGELRNCISHVRFPNEVTQKEGEAAIAWFESILLKSNKDT